MNLTNDAANSLRDKPHAGPVKTFAPRKRVSFRRAKSDERANASSVAESTGALSRSEIGLRVSLR
jgi:hypothetical protein